MRKLWLTCVLTSLILFNLMTKGNVEIYAENSVKDALGYLTRSNLVLFVLEKRGPRKLHYAFPLHVFMSSKKLYS